MTTNFDTDDGDDETSDDRPTIAQQYSFAIADDGETDGTIEPAEETVETDLGTWGADLDHRERESRQDKPEASSFGVDDRPEVTASDDGEQGTLFADAEDDQQTLTGERAASQCLFESDDRDDEHDEEPDTASDELAETTDTASPQAVATDGGQPIRDDESSEENEDTTFDPDEETVTNAWEGAFISAQWGYGQTNVELAQIVEVSESGKTVLARLVGAERVGHGRTSKQLRPTANQYGDEFRLHVRDGIDGEPRFRGSYPLGSDGDMNDGPTRRGSFYPWDNDPENSIRATRTGFGH